MSRLSNKEIMDLLVEEGLDKRIAENPEGAEQIASIVKRAISQRDLRKEYEWTGEEYAEAVKRVLNDRVTPFDGYRYNDDIQINGDGSLSVKYETDSDYVIRRDCEKRFSVEKENGGLVIRQKRETFYLAPSIDPVLVPDEGTAKALKTVIFQIFNESGLQLQERSLGQEANIWHIPRENRRIPRNCNEVFDVATVLINSGVDEKVASIQPFWESYTLRNKDMVTGKYGVSEIININTDPVSYMDEVFDDYAENDEFIGRRIIQDEGTFFVEIDSEDPGKLEGPCSYNWYDKYQRYEKAKSEGRDEAEKRRLYEEGCKYSPQFRATLLEQAKTDPELQKVVASLALDGKVKTADLEKVYESVSDRDIKAQMDKIREASKDDKETDKKRESDGNPEL